MTSVFRPVSKCVFPAVHRATNVPAALLGAAAAPESVWLEAFRDSSDNGFAADFTFSDDPDRAVMTKTAGVVAESALTPFFSNNSSSLVIATDPDGLAMVDGDKIQVATSNIPGYTNVGTWLIELLVSESVGNNIILAGDSSSVNFLYNSTGTMVSCFVSGAATAADAGVTVGKVGRYGITYDGSGLRIGGSGMTVTSSASVVASSQTTVRFMNAGADAFNGRLRKVKWIPRKLTANELECATADISIACHGDSMTHGNMYPLQLVDQLLDEGLFCYLTQRGISGGSWTVTGTPAVTLINDAATQIDPQISRLTNLRRVLVLFAGTNGLAAGHTAAQEFADFETYLDDRITAGWDDPDNIIVATMLPRGPSYETLRTDYNALLVAGATTYGYRLARLDLDPLMGYAGAYADTTYFSDGLHPTYPVGAAVVASVIRTAIG